MIGAVAEAAIRNHAAFIWSVADLLRGDYKQAEYQRVILPLVVLRRLDCVLEPTKVAVLKRKAEVEGRIENLEPVLQTTAGQQFFNTSKLDFRRLLDDPPNIADNLRAYIAGFSIAARDVLEKFDFNTHIARLDKGNLLYHVVSQFADRSSSRGGLESRDGLPLRGTHQTLLRTIEREAR